MERKPELILQMDEQLFRRQIEVAVLSVLEIFNINIEGFDPKKYASDFASVYTKQFLEVNLIHNVAPPNEGIH